MAKGHMGDDEDLTHEVNSFQDCQCKCPGIGIS